MLECACEAFLEKGCDLWVCLRVTGFWYSPECEYVRECLLRGQLDVNGTVKLRLYKGSGTQLLL